MAAGTSTDEDKPNPRNPSSDYKAMAEYWRMVDAILAGVEALRSVAGISSDKAVSGPVIPYANLSQFNTPKRARNTAAQSIWLPQLPGESNEDYDYRRRNAPLTNLYDDISRNLASKPFSKKCELAEDSDQRLLDLQDDIDGQGNSLHVFAAEVFKNGIDKAIDWIFVDYDNVGRVLNLAEEKASGTRPYWIHIPAERMLAVYSDFVNGEEVFVHCRIYEPVMERDNWTEKCIERVRIFERAQIKDDQGNVTGYDNPVWQLWELVIEEVANTKKTEEKWTMIDSGTITLPWIPLVPFRTGKRVGSSWEIIPPLKNLANMQIEEFQQESNLKSIKEAAAFPMLAGNGVAPPQKDGVEIVMRVGPKVVLFAPPQPGGGAGGSWSYVEPSATSLTFLAADLEKLRTEMRDLGMQPLTAMNLTVITTANLSSKAQTAVQAWALGLKDALEMAFWFTEQWLGLGVDNEVEVNVYDDFGIEVESGDELNSLLAAEAQGIISKRTVQDEFKRRRVLSDEFDPDEEAKLLAKQQADLTPELAIDPVTGKPIHPEPFKPGKPVLSINQQAAATKTMVKASTPPGKPN